MRIWFNYRISQLENTEACFDDEVEFMREVIYTDFVSTIPCIGEYGTCSNGLESVVCKANVN